MRLHRKNHFDHDGTLLARDRPLYVNLCSRSNFQSCWSSKKGRASCQCCHFVVFVFRFKAKNPTRHKIPTLSELEQSTVIISTGTSHKEVNEWLHNQGQPETSQQSQRSSDDSGAKEISETEASVEKSSQETAEADAAAAGDSGENELESDEDDTTNLEVKPFTQTPAGSGGKNI